ncbi:hypothetical protein D3C80_1017920 [compost metagenome]
MEGRADFAFQISGRQKCRVRIDFRMHRLEVLRQACEMLRLGSEFQLPGTTKIAVYAFLGNDCLERVDGIVERLVKCDRPLLAQFLLGGKVTMRKTVVQMAAIAPRGTETDGISL